MQGNGNNADAETIYDVIIIGGGPAGLSAALYTARAGLGTLVLDRNPAAGALGYAGRIENYPGVPGAVRGSELLAVFRKQAEHFGAEVRQEQVYGVDFGSEPKRVVAMEKSYGARAVIIATGAMGRKPSIKGEAELLGMGVSYCAACDAAFYKDKDVAVAGGLDEVIDEVESLVRFARRVYLVTREKELSPEQRAALERLPNVVLKTDSRLTAIEGEVTVKAVIIARGGAEERLDVEGVFLYLHGSRPVTDFLYGALETSPEGCLMVDENMATSIAGVFAVGDVRCKKIRQVVVSTAEGCIAALAAERYINKREKIQPQWSH